MDKRASTLDSAKAIGLDANHTMLNKFSEPGDPSYEQVAGELAEMADHVKDTYQKKRKGS